MAIPVSRDRSFVGRSVEIAATLAALLKGPGARVLLHGLPGVGKDSVAVEVVSRSEIEQCPGLELQAWIQGSTDDGFRRQLVQVFATHRPVVIRTAEGDQGKCLELIKTWLRNNEGWLFVIEDATWECRALWKVLPFTTVEASDETRPMTGRVLITSQDPLHAANPGVGIAANGSSLSGKRVAGPQLRITMAIELEPLDAVAALEVWRQMHIFTKAPTDLEQKLEPELCTLCESAGVPWIEANPNGESRRAQKQRLRTIAIRLHTEHQLASPSLLGGCPQYTRMLTSDNSGGSIRLLIRQPLFCQR